ncbi:ribbon-helix-helix domain-containing protein [Acidiphilium cryptum]|uniref:CopG domain protein DNA-binding domain protein n=1 Tax=Acidiphilium cryptum (strain JF-5) TaxID=349163 RepID=A5FWM8_ACICJ|nr:ribbon-helix-helix domain-containing protein [Acidiphilium cryptum]ABQ30010.1 CopG domain protein DNA-binding domain protein [Acidiphilium cryptum JF-5]
MTVPHAQGKIEAECCTLQQTVQKSDMAAKQRVTVNLTDEEYEALSLLSQRNRVSLAWLGRQAIIEFLDRYADGQQQLPLVFTPRDRKSNK